MLFSRRPLVPLLMLGASACFGPLFEDHDRARDWDGDGVARDADCDDGDPQVTQSTFWPDADGDGYGTDGEVAYGCDAPDGYAENDDDCDDADPLAWRETAWYEDLDLDGYGVGDPAQGCAGYGASEIDGDCDDARADVHPGAEPVCGNGVDDDCDGLGDCGGPSSSDGGESWDGKYSGAEGAELGASVAGAGDVNGDGYADLLLGAPGATDDDGEDVGGAVLIHGPPPSSYTLGEGLSGVSRLVGTRAGGRAGEVVAGAGDLDGDGYADLLVGAPEAGEGGGFGGGGLPMALGPGGGGFPGGDGAGGLGGGNAGLVYVVLGPVVGQEVVLGENISTGILQGSDGGGRAGAALVGLGDVTGDGYEDVLVGAPRASNGDLDEAGAVWLVPGPFTEDTTLSRAALWTLGGPAEADRFGTSVAALGDLDGDGQGDFAVGAPTDALNGADDEPVSAHGLGRVYLYLDFRESSDDADITDLVLTGPFGGGLGATVSGVGDVDGDGTPDLGLGSPGLEGAGEASGAVIILSGAGVVRADDEGTDLAAAQIAQIDGGAELIHLGTAACGPGDLDGDLVDDLLIGAPESDEERGTVTLFYGPPPSTATLAEAAFALTGDYPGTRLGHAVAGVGDANGLGRADMVFSTLDPSSEDDSLRTGYVYFLPSDGL